MGKGGQNVESSQLSWSEVEKHTKRDDRWLVINNEVYNITEWAKRHPGGSRVISHFSGQDASEAFRAFHNDQSFVKKFLKPIHIGSLPPTVEYKDMKEDFDELRETVHKMGLFKPSVTFFTKCILELIFLEVFGFWVLYTFGTGWIPWLISVCALATVQAQAGWVQHDYGHLSVFKKSWINHMFHQYTMCFTKGASAHWWNHLHYQHHAKPNVMDKDPDVRLDAVFVLGNTMADRVAKNRKWSMPFNWQHRYFFAIGPPLLFPLYFQYMVFKHSISRKQWVDVFAMMLFYIRFFYLASRFFNIPQTLFFYFIVRCLESHWFVWVSQSNHIPMEIEPEKNRPWLPLQLWATCDIEKGIFNDWFTGHLNFQIEHHLFPTMPRHNLYKAAPLVKTLCKKHNIPYVTKSLLTSFKDIVETLENSGQIWLAYYQSYHHN